MQTNLAIRSYIERVTIITQNINKAKNMAYYENISYFDSTVEKDLK